MARRQTIELNFAEWVQIIVIQLFFSINRDLSASSGEPDDYIVVIDGHVQDEAQEEVGRLKGYIIQVERASEQEKNLYLVCDAHSQTIADYYEALFDLDTDEIKDAIQRQLDSFHTGDILILDRIEVLPLYRKTRARFSGGLFFH